MGIHDLPKKWRERANGDAGLLACAEELEAHLKDAMLCYVSSGFEIGLEVIVPDAIFKETMRKPSSCTLSTKRGYSRTAILVFD